MQNGGHEANTFDMDDFMPTQQAIKPVQLDDSSNAGNNFNNQNSGNMVNIPPINNNPFNFENTTNVNNNQPV